jgi:hypothetical protein
VVTIASARMPGLQAGKEARLARFEQNVGMEL